MRIKKGFTLIELMVTVSILVIIVMLAAPSFTNLLVKQNLNSNIPRLVLCHELGVCNWVY